MDARAVRGSAPSGTGPIRMRIDIKTNPALSPSNERAPARLFVHHVRCDRQLRVDPGAGDNDQRPLLHEPVARSAGRAVRHPPLRAYMPHRAGRSEAGILAAPIPSRRWSAFQRARARRCRAWSWRSDAPRNTWSTWSPRWMLKAGLEQWSGSPKNCSARVPQGDDRVLNVFKERLRPNPRPYQARFA